LRTYELDFRADALKEWRALGSTIREQFRRKLVERLTNPHIPSARLSGMPNCYKIKLRAAGYRLIYQVEDEVLVVLVIAVGRRERNAAYRTAAGRIEN
jgi:mRNA interferase RelE/StbE